MHLFEQHSDRSKHMIHRNLKEMHLLLAQSGSELTIRINAIYLNHHNHHPDHRHNFHQEGEGVQTKPHMLNHQSNLYHRNLYLSHSHRRFHRHSSLGVH